MAADAKMLLANVMLKDHRKAIWINVGDGSIGLC